jgi:hypothetical protein
MRWFIATHSENESTSYIVGAQIDNLGPKAEAILDTKGHTVYSSKEVFLKAEKLFSTTNLSGECVTPRAPVRMPSCK